MILHCIAIEDEPPALEQLSRFIQQTPFLQLSGRYENALEGLSYVQDIAVDLIFLDIQMPDISGIELARILHSGNSGKSPAIIFTTAFDQFAIEGYKLDIVDYLLKPFGYDEFLRAASKAQQLVRLRADAQLKQPATEDYLYLKVEHLFMRIPFRDIVYIEGLKDYAKVHLTNPDRTLLSLITLKSLEEKLPAARFMRIHKSTIISLDKVTSLSRNAVNIGELMFTVSEQYKENFSKLLERWR